MSTEREALRIQDIIETIARIDGYVAGLVFDALAAQRPSARLSGVSNR